MQTEGVGKSSAGGGGVCVGGRGPLHVLLKASHLLCVADAAYDGKLTLSLGSPLLQTVPIHDCPMN